MYTIMLYVLRQLREAYQCKGAVFNSRKHVPGLKHERPLCGSKYKKQARRNRRIVAQHFVENGIVAVASTTMTTTKATGEGNGVSFLDPKVKWLRFSISETPVCVC